MAIRFIEIVNNCKETIRVYLRFPRPKKPRELSQTSFSLSPGHSSRPVPYPSLVGARDWDRLHERSCIKFNDVPWTPSFALVQNKSREPLNIVLRLPPKKRRAPKTRIIRVPAGKTSPPLHLPSLLQKRQLKSLARRKAAKILPLAYIGPRVGDPPAVGSFGYEDVYVCYDCGKPIVFRGSPPVPIHVG